jgi:hypothetical protein
MFDSVFIFLCFFCILSVTNVTISPPRYRTYCKHLKYFHTHTGLCQKRERKTKFTQCLLGIFVCLYTIIHPKRVNQIDEILLESAKKHN